MDNLYEKVEVELTLLKQKLYPTIKTVETIPHQENKLTLLNRLETIYRLIDDVQEHCKRMGTVSQNEKSQEETIQV